MLPKFLKEIKDVPYVIFFCHINFDLTLTIYYSSKGYKAFFSGQGSLNESLKWDKNASINIPKEKVESYWKDTLDQIGSDEVGTGDFFGPVVVVASYVPSNMIPLLKELGVDDSKKLTDKKILEIVPKIIDKVIHVTHICKPEKYNEQINKGQSMNEIKAILHNDALIKVRKKINSKDMKCYVDMFTPVDSYYRYLDKWNYVPLTNNIVFETKGESHYPSVAVSSMIARYEFIKYMDELSAELNVTILKGASTKVDELALSITKKYGIKKLDSLVKKNFVNYKKLLDD